MIFSDAIVKADLISFMFEIKLTSIHFIGGWCYILVEGLEVVAWILYDVLITALFADWIMESIVEIEIVLDSHLVHFRFVIIAILSGWQVDQLWELVTVLKPCHLRRFRLHLSL